MALGTPVAGAAAYSASAGTTVAPAYPAGILATDVVLLFLGQKPSAANGGTATTPAGWTLREELLAAGGYGTTLGADTGNTNLRVYSWDSPVAGQTGTRSVTLAGNGVSWAFIVRIPTGGGAISFGSADGQRTTTPTSPMSIALTNGATATDFAAGDKAIWAMCIPTDVTTPSQFSAESITATGAVFATATELNEPDSATGNDIGGYSAYAHVNSGSSTTAPTVTATLAGTLTNVRGPVVLLRVREAAPPTNYTVTANNGTYAVTGQAASITQGFQVVANNGTYAVAGQDATITYTPGSVDYPINGLHGTYAVSGQAAGVYRNRSLSASAGSYTVSGQAAALLRSKKVTANNGTYSVNGQSATLLRSKKVTANNGTYAVAGQQASILKTRNLSAENGSYAINGQDATIAYVPVNSYVINALNGSYSIAGQAASIIRQRSLLAGYGSYSVNGQSAAIAKSRELTASSGSYAVAGQAINVSVNKVLVGSFGTYTVTGNSALLVKSIGLYGESGNYSLAGQTASVRVSSVLIADSGSYSIVGRPVSIVRNLPINAESGVYSVNAGYVSPGYVVGGYFIGNASILIGRLVTGVSGSYTSVGQNANIAKSKNVQADNGTYAIAGQDAVIYYQPPPTYKIRAWNGATWVTASLRVWNGEDWIARPLKKWNGSIWVE